MLVLQDGVFHSKSSLRFTERENIQLTEVVQTKHLVDFDVKLSATKKSKQ